MSLFTQYQRIRGKMVQRAYPEQFFNEGDNRIIYFGIIIVGIIACVSIVAIVKWGK